MPSFTIPGTPFGKQRVKATARGGFARVYTPQETVSFERTVGTLANPHFPAPLEGPVRVTIEAVFEPAASWSKRKRDAAMGQPHTQKPDLSNVQKGIEDGLNRIAYADDSQIAEVRCRKRWGVPARTEVTVERLTLDLLAQVAA